MNDLILSDDAHASQVNSRNVHQNGDDSILPSARQLDRQAAWEAAYNFDPTNRGQTRIDEAHLSRYLDHLMEGIADRDVPTGLEIRVINCWRHRDGALCAPPEKDGKAVRGGIYSGVFTNPRSIIREAHRWTFGRVSAYVCLGAVNLDRMRADRGDTIQLQKPNEMHPLERGCGVANRHVDRVDWFYIDVDPQRPPTPPDDPERKFNSSADELAETIRVRDAILAAHPMLARSAIWGCSGNGAWILVKVDHPNDAKERDGRGNVGPGPFTTLRNRCLALIARLHGTPGGNVDGAVKNSARLAPLIGVLKSKAAHSAERPRRLATIDSPPLGQGEVLTPCDLGAWFAANDDGKGEVAKVQRPTGAMAPGRFTGGTGWGSLAKMDPGRFAKRVAAMLNKVGPAVSGQKGHHRTFDAACVLVKGYDLSPGEAASYLQTYNQILCQPPWAPDELLHKLEDADEASDDRPRGYLLADDREPNGTRREEGPTPDLGGITFEGIEGTPTTPDVAAEEGGAA